MWRPTYQKLDNFGAREISKNDVKKKDDRQQKTYKVWLITIKLQTWCLNNVLFTNIFQITVLSGINVAFAMMSRHYPWRHQWQGASILVLLTTDVIMRNIQPYGFLDAVLFVILFCHWFICHIVTIAMLAMPTCTRVHAFCRYTLGFCTLLNSYSEPMSFHMPTDVTKAFITADSIWCTAVF